MSTRKAEFQIREHVPLAPFTTLGIGGTARWFATATADLQVEQAAQFASERGLRLFVLGGGSNLVVSDAGFPGMVLHMAIEGKAILPAEDMGNVLVEAAAGESWDGLVQFTVERDLAGMECLAGIPGTVGGTPVQNVGAYGQEVSQTILRVRCWDLLNSCFVELDNAACGFAYRTSLLNTSERGRYIVTRVTFSMEEHGQPNLSYADLQRRFFGKATPTLVETAEAVRSIRRLKGMVIDKDDPDTRSAGSFFKNPLVSRNALERVAASAEMGVSAVPHWSAGDSVVKLPAAWLLERAGFVRGYTLGRVGISSKHTLALVNRGDATEQDLAALRGQIITTVRKKFGVELQQEPVNVR